MSIPRAGTALREFRACRDGYLRDLRRSSQQGIALITTLLIMTLMSALLIGFTTVVMSDQRYRSIDRDRVRAFYAAQSGIEKLNSDLANLFFVNVAPSETQIAALGDAATEPGIPDVVFSTGGGGDPYGVTLESTPAPGPISTGTYQGLIALKKVYRLDSSVRTTSGGEAHLMRKVETVAIPVFQFGIFSDVDLSFHAGPNFDFGGRVHTNGNLFLAEGNGSTLTVREKVTAVKEVIRQRLVNGVLISASPHLGTVRMATAPGAFRNLTAAEGSVVDSVGSALNEPTWTNASLTAYNGYIRNGKTGVKALNLPLLTSGGTNADLVRRPPVAEDTGNPTLLGERYFSKVSLRILLSDTAADITNLPTVTTTPPVSLDGNWVAVPPNNGTAYGPINATHPPVALSRGIQTAVTNGATAAGATTVTVVAVPAFFRPAVITIGGVAVTCTGRTVSTFTGCVNTPVAAIGAAATATLNSVALTTNLTVATALNAATITVTANSAIAFAPTFLWSGSTLITCTGTTPTTFTGCAGTPAIATASTLTTSALSSQGTGVLGGFIKIEMQNTALAWTDVTMQILNYGIGGSNQSGTICADPTPNAIIRLQRLRDNTVNGVNGTGCNYAGSTSTYDYWPSVLFDTREGLQRDVNPGVSTLVLDGVMYYVALDIGNLSKWLAGTAPFNDGIGISALSANGYSVYFSDRRNNRDAANLETGEYGFEDVINPATAGVPGGTLDTGEDVNANTALETYGQFPSYGGASNTLPPGSAANAAPFDAAGTIRPTTAITVAQAKTNRAYLFRRALKLINGGLGKIIAPGFTVASENPVYIQGDYNANQAGFGNPHVATSVVADAVTLLSNNWNDNISFSFPYTPGSRARSAQSYYRVAIIAGKNAPFPNPAGAPAMDFGTDGGAHNFLRMLEAGGGTVNYRGSLVTFYFSRQAVGTYKGGNTIYGAPTRAFAFDTDFLDPAKLPPLTPVFRDLNALGFTQETRPGR